MAVKALPCPTRARLFVKYNPETGDMIWNSRARCFFETDHEFKRWNSRYAGKPALRQTNNEGYRTGCIAKARIKAHQLAVALSTGAWPNGDVDHIDGDKANNAAANLRVVTHQQNTMNRARHKNGKSRFKGVAWNENLKKWTAQINLRGRRWYLGAFCYEIEAALAYNKAAEEIHGEFARTNEV